MHNFYRAIGFGSVNIKKTVKDIIENAVNEYVRDHYDNTHGNLIEIFVQVNKTMGIAIHGELVGEHEFEIEYSFPFVKVNDYQFYDNILIEKNVSSYSFSAECDNKENGVMIIFYLQNCLDYVNKKMPEKVDGKAGFSGLCLNGTVILPSKIFEEYDKNYSKIRENKSKLITDAQNGDENAIENLTLDEMNIYSSVIQRIQSEDLYSIVDTTFMPYGMECDRYTIVGKILEVEKYKNRFTGEQVYNLLLECNNIIINVAVNDMDVYGEPKVGRRFKGNIWLQGRIDFNE